MKKTLEQELAEMLEDFPAKELIELLRNIAPMWKLFDVDDDRDWVVDEVGEENEGNVRILRSFYLVSKLADNCAALLCRIKFRHGGLWKRMEKIRDDVKDLKQEL